MKKILSAALAAVMTLTGAAASAQAAGRVNKIAQTISDKSEIHILYNDKVVQYEDVKPVNTDGRVMIPFRAALENMGASVDYDNEARLVTAKKGDTEIKFTLMDTVIYVNKNGAESTVTMDTPMIIVSDRTLVPIRFMSDAFGMQIGWDGSSETVMIVDYDDYAAELNSLIPNITKISSLGEQPQGISDTSFEFALNTETGDNKIDAALSGKMQSTGSASFDFSGFGTELKDAKLEAAAADGKVYIKTDFFEKIAPQIKDEKTQNGVKLIASDRWYCIDLEKLMGALNVPKQSIEFAMNAVKGETSSLDLGAMIKSMCKTEGDTDLDTTMMLALYLDTYEELDKYVSVTEKENGGYEIKLNITQDEFDKLMLSMMGDMSDEEKKAAADAVSFYLNESCIYDGEKGVTDLDTELNANADNTKVGLKIKLHSETKPSADAAKASAPAESTDITDMLIGLLNK